jgi:uncharacterized protein (TIGR00369 family)
MQEEKKAVSPFWAYLGMKEQVMEHGSAEVRLDVFPDLLQRRGIVHGGVIATLIDASIGSAVRSTLGEDGATSTIELKTNYLRPAKGAYLIAKASLYHRGGTTAVGKSEVFDDAGNLIAVGTATFMLFEKQDSGIGQN